MVGVDSSYTSTDVTLSPESALVPSALPASKNTESASRTIVQLCGSRASSSWGVFALHPLAPFSEVFHSKVVREQCLGRATVSEFEVLSQLAL